MKITILEISTHKLIEAYIRPVSHADLENVAWKGDDKGRFPYFNWKEIGRGSKEGIYKLEVRGEILGLIKFFHEAMLLKTIEINKIEVSIENFGKTKKYDFIAGCLIAYACLESQKHYTGEVYVMASKERIPYYIGKYGMKIHNKYYLVSDRENCKQLILKYLPAYTTE